MSVFTYTLPSGSEFVVRGPAGATQAEADRIFYEQVAAGALVGYESGQTLTSTATQITKFELSRLDRGTAGVDTPTVLAVVQSLPVIATIPSLTTVLLTNPIDEADIANVTDNDLGPESVGTLNTYQVQKLLAQVTKLVNQNSDQISLNKGVGQYGFTAYALEQAGYVKPGTSLRFFAVTSEDFVAVMSSPSVWTGKNGVYSLNDLLNDSQLQNRVQVQLMQQGYSQLEQTGVITQTRSAPIELSSGQVYTTGGLQSIQNLTAASVLSGLSVLDPTLSRGVLQNIQSPGTVLNRLANTTAINLSTIGSGAVNGLTEKSGNLINLSEGSIGAGIANQINGGVGALVINASKFGAQATSLWVKSGGLDGVSNLANTGLGNLGTNISRLATGQLTNITGSLTSNLNNITTNLTNLIPGNLTNLASNLDVFGKAGSFATNFANPLSNLNNLGNLGTLGNLGSLTNLGNLASIGNVGDLFGGSGDLLSGTAVAGGFNNTVNRDTVDAAFARVVGSPKVPLPVFQYPSLASLGPRLDIQQAVSFLRSQSAGRTFGQGVTV